MLPGCGHCLPDDCSNSCQQLRFQPLGIDRHFAGGNLLFGGAVIAKLADAEALLRAHGRPKDAAGHGTGLIQVTKAGDGISAAQGSSLAKSSKRASAFFRGVQKPRHRIAGETLGEALDRFPRSLANGTGAFRIGHVSSSQSLLKTGRIQLMDSEDPHAALRATGFADQPVSAAAGGVRQRGVENLYQLGVTRRKHGHFSKKRRKPGRF